MLSCNTVSQAVPLAFLCSLFFDPRGSIRDFRRVVADGHLHRN